MKSLVVFFFLLIIEMALLESCKKEDLIVNEGWQTSSNIIKYEIEIDSLNRTVKRTRYINDSLSQFFTYSYSDSLIVKREYNSNSELKLITAFHLDNSGKTTLFYELYPDSSVYSTHYVTYTYGDFPETIEMHYGESDPMFFDIYNNGSNLEYLRMDMFWWTLKYSNKNAVVRIPLEGYSPWRIEDNFLGPGNEKLLSRESSGGVGPGSGVAETSYEYVFDSEGRVTEMKKYKKSWGRDETKPEYGIIQIFRFEYIVL